MALQLVEMDWFVVMCQLNRTKSIMMHMYMRSHEEEEDTVERTHTYHTSSQSNNTISIVNPASRTVQWVCRALANGSRLIN